jgi:hypothetical protein
LADRVTEIERECRQSWHEAALWHLEDHVDMAAWTAHLFLYHYCHQPERQVPPSEYYRPHLGEARRKLRLPVP